MKQLVDAKRFLYAPCLMTNLQPSEGEPHLQLCSKIFLDMFPTISPSQVKTSEIKRCCLFHYIKEDEVFDFRHYAIQILPMGIASSTSKLINNKVPDLGSYKDVSDFFKSEIPSESEVEDIPSAVSVNSVIKKKGKSINHQSKVKLFEIGPRLSLELIKVEDGMCNGTVLYHKYVTKTSEEKLEIQKKREKQRLLKKKRSEKQDENVKKKQLLKEEHRERCLKGMGIDAVSLKRKNTSEDILKEDSDHDDDYAYFKEEVGEEPEKDLFKKKQKDRSQYKRFSKKKKT
ncbi:Suppressor of SWI4 1-like protein [Armadillidium nasatum]|uniref:Suppressor of SWI4 1-like protein n=1 Tax=Armadillidium nasatum TaxID=96803 RepID=A0A5N5TK89_9CRUS|nr:Suppressor of SWI4 1-like protein [Armadillidium nasatum]